MRLVAALCAFVLLALYAALELAHALTAALGGLLP